MPPNGENTGFNKPKYTPPPQRTRQTPFSPYVQQNHIPKTDLHTGAIPNEDFLREERKTSPEKNRPLHSDEKTALYSTQKKAAIQRRSESIKNIESMKADLRGEFGEDVPHLEQKIRDFDAQIRDLRVQRKATDTWLMKTFSNGNQRLEQIDASEQRIIAERDGIRDRMEAILHPEVVQKGKNVIQQARDIVVGTVAGALAEKFEQKKPLSGRDVLRMQRGKLEEELLKLPKWPASLLPWNSMAKNRILDALDKNAKSMEEFFRAELFKAQEAASRVKNQPGQS